jgi:prephenate dehydratase
MNISIQGTKGSYSHIAAEHIFGNNIELLERDSFKEVFQDASENNTDFGVIPIENSTHGSVFQNFDLLTQNNLHITKELYLKINFHLIGHPGVVVEDLTDLYTHPVALSQIQSFLSEHKKIDAHEYPDTGGGVEMIKEKSWRHAAGAASKLAAEIYGMDILEENIHDNPKNYTRFFVLSNTEEYDKDANKTSIQFELEHKPGTLSNAIKCFADQDISLMKIESRPIIDTEWEYRFYVDLLAGLFNSKMQTAIKNLQNYARNLRVLGTYKEGEYIET